MKQLKSILSYPLLLAVALFSCFSSCEAKTRNWSADINLVASTPGDEQIKSLLAISPETIVDFIRWNLIFTTAESGSQTFALKINYGAAQPNTLGFKNGGEKNQ